LVFMQQKYQAAATTVLCKGDKKEIINTALREAEQLWGKADRAGALALLQEALPVHPTHIRLLHALAGYSSQIGLHDQAIAYAEQACSVVENDRYYDKPSDVMCRNVLANAYFAAGQAENAVQCAEVILKLAPDNIIAFNLRKEAQRQIQLSSGLAGDPTSHGKGPAISKIYDHGMPLPHRVGGFSLM